jgi:hypothetical protein
MFHGRLPSNYSPIEDDLESYSSQAYNNPVTESNVELSRTRMKKGANFLKHTNDLPKYILNSPKGVGYGI